MLVAAGGCVRATSARGGEADAAPSPADGPVDSTPHWDGFAILEFQALWALPHTLAWGWRCEQPPADFDHYELCYAPAASGLGGAETRCIGPAEDENLVVVECGAGLHMASAYDLPVESSYVARVRAYSTAGSYTESPEVTQTTLAEAASEIVVFDDELMAGASLEGLERSTEHPRAGTHALVGDPVDEDWSAFTIRDLTLPFDALDAARFESAHVVVHVDTPRPKMIWLLAGAEDADVARFAPPAGYASADGHLGYQRFEIPLSRMYWEDKEGTLTAEQAPTITSLSLGARWGVGRIYVDEVAVRY